MQCKICDKTNHATDDCFKIESLKNALFITSGTKFNNNYQRPKQTQNYGYQSYSNNLSSFNKYPNSAQEKRCSYCHNKNHTYDECKTRLGLCYTCGSKEHLAKNCHKKSLNYQ